MVYTVGRTSSYQKALTDYGSGSAACKKLGRRGADDPDHPNYPGGSCWETIEEAQNHCPDEFSVYAVDARWGIDTAPSQDGDWHDLLVDAHFFELMPTF